MENDLNLWIALLPTTIDRLFAICLKCVCVRGYFCAKCQPASQLNRPLTYSSDWKSNYLKVSNGIQYIFGMERRKGNIFLNSANNKYMGAFSEIQFHFFFLSISDNRIGMLQGAYTSMSLQKPFIHIYIWPCEHPRRILTIWMEEYRIIYDTETFIL